MDDHKSIVENVVNTVETTTKFTCEADEGTNGNRHIKPIGDRVYP